MTFKIGDRVKFKHQSSHSPQYVGTVTALGNAVRPHNFERYDVAYIRWDKPSLMCPTGLDWDVECIEHLVSGPISQWITR